MSINVWIHYINEYKNAKMDGYVFAIAKAFNLELLTS